MGNLEEESQALLDVKEPFGLRDQWCEGLGKHPIGQALKNCIIYAMYQLCLCRVSAGIVSGGSIVLSLTQWREHCL